MSGPELFLFGLSKNNYFVGAVTANWTWQTLSLHSHQKKNILGLVGSVPPELRQKKVSCAAVFHKEVCLSKNNYFVGAVYK
jgi:hypothetical protein